MLSRSRKLQTFAYLVQPPTMTAERCQSLSTHMISCSPFPSSICSTTDGIINSFPVRRERAQSNWLRAGAGSGFRKTLTSRDWSRYFISVPLWYRIPLFTTSGALQLIHLASFIPRTNYFMLSKPQSLFHLRLQSYCFIHQWVRVVRYRVCKNEMNRRADSSAARLEVRPLNNLLPGFWCEMGKLVGLQVKRYHGLKSKYGRVKPLFMSNWFIACALIKVDPWAIPRLLAFKRLNEDELLGKDASQWGIRNISQRLLNTTIMTISSRTSQSVHHAFHGLNPSKDRV